MNEEQVTTQNIPEDTQTSINNSLSSLAESMANYDTTTSITQEARNKLLVAHLPAALAMDMSDEGNKDPEQYQAKSRLISEVRGLLNDIDSSSKNHVGIKLKQQDTEINATNAISTAELLKSIKLTGGVPVSNAPRLSDEEVDELIKQEFDGGNLVIPETELETGGIQLPVKEEEVDEMGV